MHFNISAGTIGLSKSTVYLAILTTRSKLINLTGFNFSKLVGVRDKLKIDVYTEENYDTKEKIKKGRRF